jgi:hypothetical protein
MRATLTCSVLALAVAARATTVLDDATRGDPEVAALVHRAAVAALVGDVGALDDAAKGVARLDDARREQSLGSTGLADNVRLLAAAARPTRDARHDALEAVLDEDPDPVVERVAKHAIEHEDDVGAAGRLLGDDRHNRRATLVNDALRPLGVFSGAAFLAALNPYLIAGSALDSLATTAINLYRYNDLSSREREALVRYRRQLSKDANTTAAPEIVEVIREINVRRNTKLCADTVAVAETALDHEELDRARFYVTSATALDGCEKSTEKVREQVATALAVRETRTEAARWPADDLVPPTGTELEAYGALAAATVLADPAAMMAAAQAFVQRHPKSDHRPAATLAVAVARDMAGHRDAAEAALREIDDDGSGAGRIATALLETPRFQGLDGLAAAERKHSREVAEFVLVGGGLDGRTALYTASQLGAQGIQAAESFGIFNVIGMVTRVWSAWWKDPASNQAIIDEGERFLAREPNAKEASEVHERLATAYERAGAHDRALLHYRAVDKPDPERVAELEEQIAERLLENAQKAGGEPALLAVLVRYYPDTDAGKKALKALETMPRQGEVPLAREVLEAHPTLLGPTGLDLGIELLDGKVENGELADAGVTVGPGALTLKLQDPKGGDDRTEQRPLTLEAYTRARAAAEDALYASALSTDPNAGEVGRFERYVPFFVAGTLNESGGISVAPGLKLRRDPSENRKLYE